MTSEAPLFAIHTSSLRGSTATPRGLFRIGFNVAMTAPVVASLIVMQQKLVRLVTVDPSNFCTRLLNGSVT